MNRIEVVAVGEKAPKGDLLALKEFHYVPRILYDDCEKL